MCKEISKAIAIAILLTSVKAHVALWNPSNHLHPVQGLYVKPSTDGTTGDLYVAATEESGSTTQWLTDQPLNFFPLTAAAQTHQAIPYTYASSLATVFPQEEAVAATQKRAVITSPTVKYAYAMPSTTTVETGTTAAYPYAVLPATPTTVEESTSLQTGLEGIPTTATTLQYPYNFFYPQLMSAAYANAVNTVKESGAGDETTSAVPTQTPAVWPTTAYTYPFQYVMVDPSAWLQAQAAAIPAAASTPATVAPAKEKTTLNDEH